MWKESLREVWFRVRAVKLREALMNYNLYHREEQVGTVVDHSPYSTFIGLFLHKIRVCSFDSYTEFFAKNTSKMKRQN